LAAIIRAMTRINTSRMFSRAVLQLARWMPRSEPPAVRESWAESDASWHSSSFELSRGLVVTEVFDEWRAAPAFADTLPAFHEPQLTTQAAAHS
jgi:hypothetical protein